MAALTPVASVESLVSAIEKSGLLAAGALEKVREAAAKASDPKALARDLVKGGVLTRWQAEQLINGYHRLVVGKYKLLDQIGTSPTGRLYLAEHVQMGRRHTLKVLARRLASNPEAVKHFLDSARNACSLDHRNISHVYDVNQDRIGHYVVMEFVEGQDLETLVERTGRVAPQQALDFARQAAEGLAHAHASGVVHGDLKPANLLRDHSGTIKILEIGQAGFGARPEAEDADESVETASLAAVIFKAPEVRGDGEVATSACDVYSVGSVLCFLLTAKAAKDAAAAAQLLEAAADCPPEMAAFCRRLMAETLGERPGSMEQVLKEIGALAQQLTAAAKTKADEKTLPDAASLKDAPRNEKWKKGRDAAVTDKVADKSPPVKSPPDKTPEDKVAAAVQVVDVAPAPGVVIPDGGQAPRAPSPPPAPFVIKTRGRIGKTARKAEGAADGDSPDVKEGKELWKPVYTPLVLAGAIGGGGVLVLGLGIVLICVLALRGGGKPAQKATQISEVAAVPGLEAAAPAGQEANLDAPPAVVDVNPEVAVAVPAEGDAPATASLPADAKEPESSAPVAGSAAKVAASEVAAAAVASPEVENKPEAAPAAKEVPEPKQTAAKPAAKPKAADPFAGFEKGVSLPELPDSADAPAAVALATVALSPVALGPCNVDDKTKLAINLVGGETAIRSSAKQRFELQPSGNNPRAWDFVLSGGPAPIPIAALTADGGKLLFQWTEEGIKQAAVAKQLCNCALTLGSKRQLVALRMPERGAPLAVDIEKPSASVKWSIGDLPVAKQLYIEVTRAEGFKVFRQEPKGPVNVGDSVVVGTGPSEKSAPLQFKLSTSSTANAIEVRLQTSLKLEGAGEARPYRRKDLINLQPQTTQDLTRLQRELKKSKDSRPRTEPEQAAKEEMITRLSNEIAASNRLLDQIRYLVDFSGATEGQAKLHFRVYCLAGEAKIDLLRTDE